MKPTLVSFKLCPFVQRAAIALQCKAVEYNIEYVELANPPQWFLKLSPLKKVPLLQVGDHIIFESTVINEYIDEAYPNRLHPDDLILRALNRAWIEFGNDCTWSAFHLSAEEEEEDFDHVLDDMWNRFDQIERAVVGAPFFNGRELSLVDVSYAPLFQRLEYLDELRAGILDEKRHPRINIWKQNLLALDAVRQSCVPEVKELYHELIWKRQGFISQFLDATKFEKRIEKSIY